MTLAEFAKRVDGFYTTTTNNERILLFVWFLHAHQAAESTPVALVRKCFNELNLAVPDVSKYMQRLALARPPQLLKKGSSYRLEGSLKTSFDEKYGEVRGTVVVSKLLNDLAVSIPDLTERAFLGEALDCYRVKAYRAAIVMTWNLAFDHILTWVVRDSNRLASFNASIKPRFPKKDYSSVGTYST